MNLEGTGIWSTELRFGDPGEIGEAAAELEELGFTALWVPGVFGGDVFDAVRRVLDATQRVVVATGIVNVWAHQPSETAERHAELIEAHPDRFLLGLGISHPEMVGRLKLGDYGKPVSTMRQYLDALDAADPPVAAGERALAALRPRMCALAAERSAGVHSYFVTPEHTRTARERIGPDVLLAPEHAVVLETDGERAREIARRYTGLYLSLANYTNNLRDLGWGDEDLGDGGSDRLTDAVAAWGEPDAIASAIEAHREHGADHVCVQVVPADFDPEKVMRGETLRLPREEWRELARMLGLSS